MTISLKLEFELDFIISANYKWYLVACSGEVCFRQVSWGRFLLLVG
jgi:hypothetical protein